MSDQTFSVGEVAIIVGDCLPNMIGDDVTIAGVRQLYLAWVPTLQRAMMVDGYAVSHPAFPTNGIVRPEYLRKKRPPQDWAKLANLTNAPRELEPA